MAQDLTLNLKTTSDVPQAMDKAKAATTSFQKQLGDIGNKFGTSFKDIFLSFLGPMALLTGAIALISKLISESQKRQQEATQAAIDGTNSLMSAEDNYYARKRNNEKKSKEDAEQAKTQREETTYQFMSNDPRGYQLYQDYIAGKIGVNRENPGERNRKFNAKTDPEVQAAIQALIAEDAKKNPIPDELTKAAEKKAGTFKGPDGFSNVVGVGANPVMDKMTRQNEIMEEIKIILQEQFILNRNGTVPAPFTERVPLTMQKAGLS